MEDVRLRSYVIHLPVYVMVPATMIQRLQITIRVSVSETPGKKKPNSNINANNMYVCPVCVCMYVCMYVCIVYVYSDVYVCIDVCVCMYVCMYLSVCMYVCMSVCMYVCLCVYVCMYVCMYV